MVNKPNFIANTTIPFKQLENHQLPQISQIKLLSQSTKFLKSLKLKQQELVLLNLKDLSIQDFLQLQKMSKAGCSVVMINPDVNKQNVNALPSSNFNSVKLKIDKESKHISFSQIIRLEACSNYSYIYTTIKAQAIFASKTLKFYSNLLNKDSFVRPHQSHIVNRSFIKKIAFKPEPYLILKDGTKVKIARRRLKAFQNPLSSVL